MSALSQLRAAPSQRILALDYLRGFFIVIIVIDHLWRWPNIFEFVSGRGELWSSAAEGFVIISGLLVGYIRGYKSRALPLGGITRKLVRRGCMLYLWMIITTLALVAASWSLHFRGDIAYIPVAAGDWPQLLLSILRLDYVHTLTHFLYLYAIYLVASPIAIWLLRRGQAWVVAIASFALWYIGVHSNIEWLQWQILFFLPAIAGYYLESITTFHKRQSVLLQRLVPTALIIVTLLSALLSAIIILPHAPGQYQSTLFGREPVTLPTIAISFVWFAGLFSLFHYALPLLRRYAGWLLMSFGARSLTAYIVHIVPLVICQLLFRESTSLLINTLLTTSCILATWALLRIPGINRIVPR